MAAALGAFLVLALSGCTTPESPEPTPTPGFSSEEEAFAAAEATYRAYVDALNQWHAGSTSSPRPTEFLTGNALESELDTQNMLGAQGRSIVGTASVARFAGTNASDDLAKVTAVVCLDVTESRVLNGEGVDVTPSDRPNVLALEVDFVDLRGDFAISRSGVAEDQTC
ncbi:MAG TPA: hypothetical protein VIP82_12435 [Microbacterium sp.]|jgi:hypothetical protein|uniref:hypothetical protein n=1 Tax=Microbacterium sp. TaxID=51671 RepID=UPI002F93AB48